MLARRTIAEASEALIENVSRAVVARKEVVHLSVISLLAGGHMLIQDLPGVGKTLLARSLASSIAGTFKRIQFTPDILPSDITGASIYRQADHRFEFVPGPIFANVVLADEVNRASTRSQSALLEAMAEQQVTADGRTYALPDPFWVIATQNEVDGYGTFPLPQAQLDRFLMRLSLGYPSLEEQVAILERNEAGEVALEPVISVEDVREIQREVRSVEVARNIKEYIARLTLATRDHPLLAVGVSPRGAVQLQRAAQAAALLEGVPFVAPEHVKAVARPVLAHRIVMAPSAPVDPADAISEILRNVPVPFW